MLTSVGSVLRVLPSAVLHLSHELDDLLQRLCHNDGAANIVHSATNIAVIFIVICTKGS